MLLSSGGFAYYRAETHAYSLVGPRFGGLRSAQQRQAYWDFAHNGFQFTRAGIPEERAKSIVIEESHDVGSYLDGFMSEICRAQGVPRWAECTPDHALFMDQIAQDFPDARFVHILRDGRDVALSLARQGWIQRLPMDSMPAEVASGFFWDWLVGHAQKSGAELGGRFHELRYEDLVTQPEKTLTQLGRFIGADLDHQTILENGVGSVSRPNTSYTDDPKSSPVGRWQRADKDVRRHLWSALGPRLTSLGYESDSAGTPSSLKYRAWRRAYHATFAAKHRVRAETPLGQWFVQAQLLETTDHS
jgi:hypothetical protein